jgi:hypothetical protein
MTIYWTYRRVTRDDGDPVSYLVYLDDRYMGEVYVVRGGWAFYDRDRQLTSFATNRDSAVNLGLSPDWD